MPSAPPLVPREHGAYAEIAVPLLTALWMRPPTLAAIAWATAGVSVFFAHEPLLVLLGRRGQRTQRTRGVTARRLLFALTVIAGAASTCAFVGGSVAARVGALVPAGLALLVGVLLARREGKTSAGEVLAGCALASVAIPVAVASGVPASTALLVWLVFAAGFGASTLAVRAVIEDARASTTRGSSRVRAAGAASVLLATLALHFMGVVPVFVPLAAAPLVIFSIVLHLAPPSPKHLRTLGWLLVAAAAATGVIVRGLA